MPMKDLDNKNKAPENNRAMDAVSAYRDTGRETDPLGMYTGVTADTPQQHIQAVARADQAVANGKKFYRPQPPVAPHLEANKKEMRSAERPVQDADDL